MIVIATDEAGYGPKLGPLVVAASVWQVGGDEIGEAFEQLAQPCVLGRQRIVVDDSKAVFRPASRQKGGDEGYGKLEAVTLAGVDWCGIAQRSVRPVGDLAPQDYASIADTPWLAKFAEQSVSIAGVEPLVQHWSQGDAQLLAIESRIVTAKAFNDWCDTGANKSDLLSHLTLGLVRRRLDQLPETAARISVYCDRHGGRRYYAPPLQAEFGDSLVAVANESSKESRYHVPYADRPFEIRFTVKGDSFPPVAFSSMVAKYLRERSMESFNQYFAKRHKGPLKPTAGYPVDADRFLADVQSTLTFEQLTPNDLIRTR